MLLQLQELLLLQCCSRVLLRCQQLCDRKGVGSSHQLEPVPTAVHALQAQRYGVLALTNPMPLQVHHSMLDPGQGMHECREQYTWLEKAADSTCQLRSLEEAAGCLMQQFTSWQPQDLIVSRWREHLVLTVFCCA
jgi:hypothetical protein